MERLMKSYDETCGIIPSFCIDPTAVETFLRADFSDNTHFFCSMVQWKTLQQQQKQQKFATEAGILSTLIYGEIITNPNEKCIVFTVENPVESSAGERTQLGIHILQHKDSTEIFQYSRQNLKETFIVMFNSLHGPNVTVNDNILAVEYNYSTGDYDAFEVDMTGVDVEITTEDENIDITTFKYYTLGDEITCCD